MDNSATTELLAACAADDESRVLAALKAGADVDGKDADGRRPLQLALPGGSIGVIRALLDAGARLDIGDQALGPKGHPTGHPPLTDAVWYRRGDVVELMLQRVVASGGDVKVFVNRSDSDGFTSLHTAAATGDPDLVRVLLAHGADATAKGSSGSTPLHVAAEGKGRGHAGIAKLLVDAAVAAGVDVHAFVEAQDGAGRSAMSLARADGGDSNVASELEKHLARPDHADRLRREQDRGRDGPGRS